MLLTCCPHLSQAFFGGVALCRVLDWFADSLTSFINRMSDRRRRQHKPSPSGSDLCKGEASGMQLCNMHDAIHGVKQPSPPLSPRSPRAAHHRHVHITTDLEAASSQCDLMSGDSGPEDAAGSGDEPALAIIAAAPPTDEHDRNIAEAVGHLGDDDCGHLIRTSMLVWLALSLHNLPEGLATLVG